MKLKRLEIMGFKSFADPFRIDFKDGISAIVGPNGCGKSNVADAIRWVLGNQSPKQLRAEKMESVIFTGSSKRKQLGMAEVILTFDNSSRRLDLEYDEVSVARKLFRTGDSEYSINGSRCRLMDITDLIVDKGLGSTGYWILESKMVGTILSSRPEDRRFLFDEAAGIVKYKIQRHRAELKLNSAADDLKRLSDIIVEVESTCQGLKRQVASFKRYKNVSDSLKSINEAIRLEEASILTKKLLEKKKQLDETSSIVGKETIAYSSRTAVLDEAKVEFGRVQLKLDEAHRKCSDLDSKLASNDRESAIAKERIQSAQTRISENKARLARERERLHRYTTDIEELSGEKVELLNNQTEFESTKIEVNTRAEKHDVVLDGINSSFVEAKKQRTEIEAEIRELQESYRRQIREEEARLQKITFYKEVLEKSESQITSISNSITATKINLSDSQNKREILRGSIDLNLTRKSTIQQKIDSFSIKISEKNQKKAVLNEKNKRLAKLLEEISSTNTIASSVEPKQGMGKAIGAFFDSFSSAEPFGSTLPENSDQGKRYAMLTSICKTNKPEKAISLADCIEESKCQNIELLKTVLSYGLLAPTAHEAKSWIKNGCSYTVVTRNGDIFRPDGFVRSGVSESNAGSLELMGILEETRNQNNVIEKEEKELLDNRQALVNEIAELVNTIETVQKDFRLNENHLVIFDTTLKNYIDELEKLRSEKAGNLSALEKLEISIEASISASVDEKIGTLQQKREIAFINEDAFAVSISEKKKVLDQLLRDIDNLNFSIRENSSRRKEIAGRVKMLEQEVELIHDLLHELTRENERSGSVIVDLNKNLKQLTDKKVVLHEKRSQEENVRTGYSKERNSLMESTAVLEREVSQIRDKLNKAKNLMITLESEARSFREKLESIPEAEEVLDNTYLDKTPEELETALSTKQLALERIGPVNMLALTEYEEASERLNYLSEQRDDLEHARASLARAIVEINTEAAQRFKETFDIVRSNFRDMFQRLFGGGEGDIIALESEDPLEGGIEIMARPKGKKLSTVIALSAGEKALAAVALLFSLYLVKPSPFCVLDELDSPFDDSNTDKFIEILRDFTDNTQFIVITHNKRTMEGADVLFGITMAEEGVSSITSVSLEDMELFK